jgi:YVTN family beta-propeller protein
MMLHQGLRRWLWHLLLAFVLMAECGCNDDLDLGAIPPFTHAYVANLGSHTVSVIDLKSFKNVNTIAVGKSPGRLAASPIDDLVFVANLGSASISVIDATPMSSEDHSRRKESCRHRVLFRRPAGFCRLLRVEYHCRD